MSKSDDGYQEEEKHEQYEKNETRKETNDTEDIIMNLIDEILDVVVGLPPKRYEQPRMIRQDTIFSDFENQTE